MGPFHPETLTFPGSELLTAREAMVLRKLLNGASNKEVARDLAISPRTVEFHRAHLMRKLGARNIAEVLRTVYARGAAPTL